MIVCELGETDNWMEYVSNTMALAAAVFAVALPSSSHSLVFAFTKTGCTSDPLNVAKRLGITVDMTARLDAITRAT
jgi:hypothetical protein